MSETPAADRSLDHPDRWASVQTLLAECLKEPTEGFVDEVQAGQLAAELSAHADVLGLSLTDPTPPIPVDRSSLQRTYLSLFEAMKQPFAPPAESPYRSWYGDRPGGLMEGPSATDMERRYAAIDASPPPGYPADHIALLLEYGALLLDSGAIDEYRAFLDEHLDWVSAFARQADDAAAEGAFYQWVIGVLQEVMAELRTRLDVSQPSESAIDSMVERVHGASAPDSGAEVFEP